jgi:hypothetical protein
MGVAKSNVVKKSAREEQTAGEKRVAIAKDALAWIEAGALRPMSGAYVEPMERKDLRKNLAQQLRDVVLGPCEVCAIGALFIAKAVRFGETSVGDYAMSHFHDSLRGHFSEKQLALIECAFERGPCGRYEYRLDETEVAEAIAFYGLDDTAARRLKRILENIIANGGTFKP